MDDSHRSRVVRYGALVAIVLVIAALIFPIVDGLSAAGFFGDKTYLLILQDNTEMRPTGGTMACMGLLTVHNGNVASLQYYNWNSPQLQALVKLDGPKSFTQFFDVDRAQLYLSNVQYDFASFAPKMQSDFYNVTGHKVDGIIAVDFTAVEAVMNITGPVTVSGEVMTSANVADRLHFEQATSTNSMPGRMSTMTFDLARLILDSSVPQKLALYSTLQTLKNEGHVLIYPNQGFWFRSASESAPPGADSISPVDTTLNNTAPAKTDLGVTRTIDYHVQLFSNGSAISALTLTYTNGCWWDYDVFSTALVPPGAELIAVQNTTSAFKGPEVTSGDGFTALSAGLTVSANATGIVTYTYIQPDVVSASGIAHHYDLFIQKQAGITSYTLNVSFQLPPGATMIHAENVGSNQVFTGDAHVSVVYM
jgi:hypothetical protein